jgi:hypothetical protein
MRTQALLASALLLALSSVARADTVLMNDGRSIEGDVLSEDQDFVQLTVKGIKLKLHRSEVKSIERSAGTAGAPAPQDPVAQRFSPTGTPAVDAPRSRALEALRTLVSASKGAGKDVDAAQEELDPAQKKLDALTARRKALSGKLNAAWAKYVGVVKACGG